ncbi:general secretion pathway protein GspD [Tenacibaculum dicentrarchi]|nr:general secretion pathway protein GspD [Tenacibaculum dicentrarchi]
MIKKWSLVLFIVFSISIVAQNNNEVKRIENLQTNLDSLQVLIPNLIKTVNFNVSNIELPSFIRAVGSETKVNISVQPQLKNIILTHNFSDASVRDIVLYLCKEYFLTFNNTGNILSLKKQVIKAKEESIIKYVPKDIFVEYNKQRDLLSIDFENDSLAIAFKKITDTTGKNLVFSPGLGSKLISGYIKNKSFESAMDKLAFSNNLLITKTKDDYYLFESAFAPPQTSNNFNKNGSNRKTSKRPVRYKKSNFYFKVLDSVKKQLTVDFENTSIASIIKDIGFALKINMFTNAPFNTAGKATVKANNITYDTLLKKILEDSKFTFKKRNNIYYFGTTEQASLRSVVIIPLMHRSIQIMNEPMQGSKSDSNFNSNYTSGNLYGGGNNGYGNNNNSNNYNNNSAFNQNNGGASSNNNSRQSVNTQRSSSFGNNYSKTEALISVLPKEIINDLDITTDVELNSFIVSGDAQKIEKFRAFIKKIDKPVPVILIEVMILEVKKSNSLSVGIELGLGEKPVNDKGTIFPSTGTGGLTLGSKTINKIIGGFSGFGSLNVGKVVPNFYANIQAMESNGDVKVRSTPKLSTLNGHQATLSNGQRTYYAVTRRDIIGSQNPQTSEIKNYVPIDADLSISIKPMVSGDEQITMSINVVQSSFNGERIDPEAPPGMNSREFTSTIRVKDQDVIILGGLEENVKNNSGTGVPFLSRIPIIKWLFSKRTRTASKAKLSVLIKPTIIR